MPSTSSTEFPSNPTRLDPYKNFKFRVKWDGKYVAGISEISALKRMTQVIRHREGGDPSTSRKSPGWTEFEPITLLRGLTQDTAFEAWATKVWAYGAALGSEVSLKDFRKDIILELYNEAGQLVMAYNIYRCWVSDYVALPDLVANKPAIAIQSITLQNEGWERDTSIIVPPEPSLNPEPATPSTTPSTPSTPAHSPTVGPKPTVHIPTTLKPKNPPQPSHTHFE